MTTTSSTGKRGLAAATADTRRRVSSAGGKALHASGAALPQRITSFKGLAFRVRQLRAEAPCKECGTHLPSTRHETGKCRYCRRGSKPPGWVDPNL